MKKILITGATGFIGSFIVEEAINRGYEVWAAVRRTSSKKYLQEPGIHFIELDFGSEKKLKEQLNGHDFDYVVHAAGVTKCLHSEEFFRTNTEGTKNLVNALIKLDMPLQRFVFVSSLSILGAIHEDMPYKDITDNDTPQPNTAYGRSKLMAEEYLRSLKDFPFVILRPTGVYGPREKDYFLMAKSIKQHVDFAVGISCPYSRFQGVRQELYSERRQCVHVANVQQTHTERPGHQPRASHRCSDMATQGYIHDRGVYGTLDRKDFSSQPRQIQYHEATKLALRHFASPQGTRL